VDRDNVEQAGLGLGYCEPNEKHMQDGLTTFKS